jgi:Putative peptidoglycan binding domain
MTLFKLSAITMAVASLAACQTMSSVGSSAVGMGQKAGSAVSQTAGAASQKAGTAQRAGTSQAASTQRAGGSQQAAPTAMAAPVMAQASGLRTTTVDAAAGADYPPARVGECYARVVTPATFGTTTERVLVRSASSTISVVPAVYGPGEERVLVKGETKSLVVIPATYEDVTERILVKAAGTQLVTTPATFKTATERRLVRAASTAWKRSSELTAAERALQNIDPNAGDVLCLVEVPAVYETVTSTVVDQPASTRSIAIPAEFTTVTKTVLKTPPSTREVVEPAVYRNVVTSKLVTPAREVRADVPAEYATKTNTVQTSAAKSEWRQIVCETNATPAKLSEIQNALTKAGFATGRTDGAIDGNTMNAVRGYQKAKGLPVDMDRYINVATVRALGLSEK